MENMTVKELIAQASKEGIEIPCYANGKPKISKAEIIELLTLDSKIEEELGVEVEVKVKNKKKKSTKKKKEAEKESVTFHRQKPVSKSTRFRKRRF